MGSRRWVSDAYAVRWLTVPMGLEACNGIDFFEQKYVVRSCRQRYSDLPYSITAD